MIINIHGRFLAACSAFSLLAGASLAFPESKGLTLSGAVQTLDGRRVSDAGVRITGIQGDTITSDTGEFEIKLDSKLHPGWPIILSIRNWLITDPYNGLRGRMFIPDPHVVVEPVIVKVTHRGDPRLLAAASIKSLVEEAASILDLKDVPDEHRVSNIHSKGPVIAQRAQRSNLPTRVKAHAILLASTRGFAEFPVAVRLAAEPTGGRTPATSFQKTKVIAVSAPQGFLEAKAAELGFTEERLRSAVNMWGQEAHAPYERGLSALHERRFAEATRYLQESLASNPEGKIEQLISLATAESAQAHYAAAENALVKAGGAETNNTTVLNNLGVVLTKEGKYGEAENALKRALSINEIALGQDSSETARNKANLALSYRAQGKYSLAESLDQQALATAIRVHGHEDHAVALALRNLAKTNTYQGRLSDAQEFAERALAIDEHLPVIDHFHVAADLDTLARVKFAQGKYEESLALNQKILENEEMSGASSEDLNLDRAVAYNSLALHYLFMARYKEAKPLFEKSFDLYVKILGPNHPNVAIVLNNLGRLYFFQGFYPRAEGLFRRALEIEEKELPDSLDTAGCLLNLGDLLIAERKYNEAKPLVEKAVRITGAVSQINQSRAVDTLGIIYQHEQRYAEAEHQFNRAISIDEAEHHLPNLATALNNLASLYCAQGKFAEAVPVLKKAIEIRTAVLGPNHPRVADVVEGLAHTLKVLGRLDEAEKYEKQAADIRAHQ